MTLSVLALGAPPLVADFAILTISAAILGYLCHRVHLESVVGFLLAGAIIGPNTLLRTPYDATRALAINDSHSFFAASGDQVVTGPTLTNVNDFRAILIFPKGVTQ